MLGLFFAAVLVAFVITFGTGSDQMRALSAGVVVPILVLNLALIRYCMKGKAWSFVGASVLGVVGVALRVAVSTQPGLEVGGGLPPAVTALYIVLGSLVAFTSYEAFIELRSGASRHPS